MTTAFKLLEKQIAQLDTLSVLLNDELEAFKQRKADDILSIAEKKIAVLSQISETDTQLSEVEGISELKQQDEFQATVAQIDDKLAELKSKNAVNERVIQMSLNNITQLKQSLLSLKNSDAMTYDKKGKAMTQTLGKGIKA